MIVVVNYRSMVLLADQYATSLYKADDTTQLLNDTCSPRLRYGGTELDSLRLVWPNSPCDAKVI
jgi:hypothetical protein